MSFASNEKTAIDSSKKCENNVESIEKSVIKSNGFFKSNCWRATLVIVLVSLLIRSLVHRQNVRTEPEADYAADDEPFLELVSEKYESHELFEWKAAPEPISKPNEPGNLGTEVVVPDDMKEEAKRLFHVHQFNLIANEMMSMNRTTEDYRATECTYISYPKNMPQVSVIIVYHNEAWSTLLRTVWSAITQSPRQLLKEIILVDDFSSNDHQHGRKLFDYVKQLPVPVIMASTLLHVGLIQARLLGASKASASVMVFLDSHCECSQGWLEPLLLPIMESRKTITVPTVDVISDEDMSIRPATNSIRGGFDLALSFTWDKIPLEQLKQMKNDRTAPIRMPAMPGGLFAIDREYFYKLGSYDENMLFWGAENLELSIRAWCCGGRILSIPCSRVGHIFRSNSPIVLPRSPELIVAHNLNRLADVWLDDYKHFYYSLNPFALQERSNVSDRKALRKNLKCKSFRWYLENIFPESQYNVKNYVFGTIESIDEEGLCLDTMGLSRHQNRTVYVKQCHNFGGNQLFLFSETNEIKEKKYCLDATRPGEPVTLLDCHKKQGNQRWIYDSNTYQIVHDSGNCLTIQDDSEVVTIVGCNDSEYQRWYVREIQPKPTHNDTFQTR